MVAIDIDKLDGRRARGMRTRDAIISALLDLIAGGDIAPTAQRIADRAGVSVRSVYQHFADVEGLYADAAARTYEWARTSAKEVDPELPLARRIELFVESRATTLETLLPFSRAVQLIEPSSERVRESRMAMEKWDKERVARVFATELRALDSPRRSVIHSGIDLICSTDAWDHLRRNGQSPRGARQVLRIGVTCMLATAT